MTDLTADHGRPQNNEGEPPSSNGNSPKTMKYTNFLVAHPYLVMTAISIFTLLAFILWQGVVDRGDTAASSPGQFYAVDEVEVQRYLTLEKSAEKTDRRTVPSLSLEEEPFQMYLYYSHRGGRSKNIWTPEGIKSIYETESQVYGAVGDRNYQIKNFEEWCLKEYDTFPNGTLDESTGVCRPPFSPVNNVVFYSNPDFTATDVSMLTQEYIDEALRNASLPERKSESNFFLCEEFNATNHLDCWVTRSKVWFGAPINTLNKDGTRKYLYYAEDNDNEQQKEHEDWVTRYTTFFGKPDPNPIKVNCKLNSGGC